jgi:hypothetical protein
VYTAGQVQPKYLNNADNFKPGYVTPDDRWDNYWRKGNNQLLGWDPACRARATAPSRWARSSPTATRSRSCQVEKVFKAVCLRAPATRRPRQGPVDHGNVQGEQLQHEARVRRDRRLLQRRLNGSKRGNRT